MLIFVECIAANASTRVERKQPRKGGNAELKNRKTRAPISVVNSSGATVGASMLKKGRGSVFLSMMSLEVRYHFRLYNECFFSTCRRGYTYVNCL